MHNMVQDRANFWKEWLFPATILLLLALFFFRANHFQFPAHLHAWTQSDRYALAYGFLDNDFDFFHPATLNLKPKFPAAIPLENPQGITSVDLPLVEYLAAALMWLNGTPAPFIFRSLMLLIGLTGLILFFRLLRLLNLSYPLALLFLILAFAAPVFTYYLNGFIPSITAVSLLFAGLWQFLRYLRSNRRKYFIYSLIFLTLAALIRKPFVMALVAVMLSRIYFRWQQKKELRDELLSFLPALVIIGSYHTYNSYLTFNYGSLFISQLMTADSLAETCSLIGQAWNNWKVAYFSMPQWVVLATGLLLLVVTYKKPKASWFNQLLLIALLWLLASGAYLLVMAQQFPAHDYYFLDSFFVPLLLLSALGYSRIRLKITALKSSVSVVVALLAFWFLNSSYTIQKERYAFKSWDRTEITRLNFTNANILLDAAGLGAEEPVLVLDSYTTNVPLMLMQRRGYTVINTTRQNIAEAMEVDADWVVIQNRFLQSDVLRNYPGLASRLMPIANNGKIGLYRKQQIGTTNSFSRLTGLDWQRQLYSKDLSELSAVFSADTSNHCQRSNQEYITLTDSVFSLDSSSSKLISLRASVETESKVSRLFVVLDISDESGYHYYDSFSLQFFFESGTVDDTNIKLMMNIPDQAVEKKKIKAYLWNPDKHYLCFNDLKFSIIDYNNILFNPNINSYEEY